MVSTNGMEYTLEEFANLFGVSVGLLAVILIAVFSIVFLIAIVAYVLNALAIFRLAKQQNVENAWMAWIPYAQQFTMGKIAEKCDERRGLATKPWGKILLFVAIGAAVAGALLGGIGSFLSVIIPILGAPFTMLASLVSWAPLVILYICCWKVFREYFTEPVHIVLLVVSIVLSAQSIILLIASFCKPNPAIDEVVEDSVASYF